MWACNISWLLKLKEGILKVKEDAMNNYSEKGKTGVSGYNELEDCRKSWPGGEECWIPGTKFWIY